MADAAVDPASPKLEATPAKAAGGAAAHTDWDLMVNLRAVLAREGAQVKADLVRLYARELGHARTSPRLAAELESALRRAVRRGITVNERGIFGLVGRKMADYDRTFLKQHLLGCVAGSWSDKLDVPKRFARTLGFARTGLKIEALVWSLMKALVRAGSVEVQGRGVAACYRKIKLWGINWRTRAPPVCSAPQQQQETTTLTITH